MANEMKIVYKKLDELREYENNPRNNENAVAAVAASIDKFGWKSAIVIDAAGVIVAGHTRAKAAAMLGHKTVPCVIADDLTDEQIRAYRLADNKTAELAGWDFEKLEAELDKLSEIDMSAFGFIMSDDVDIDEFFTDTEDDGDSKKEKEPQRVQCPHCGEWFEVE